MPKYIDAFGKMKLDGNALPRARLIQLRDSPRSLTFAAFPEDDPTTPSVFIASSPPRLNGRNLAIDLADGSKLEFQRASCGCQTPSSLRGPQSRMLALVPPMLPSEP